MTLRARPGDRYSASPFAISGSPVALGLSHIRQPDVTTIRATRRVALEDILLADHTNSHQDSVVQVAPINGMDKRITDSAQPAGIHLEVTNTGVELILAES